MQGTTFVAPARRVRRVTGPIATALATAVALVGGLLAAAPAQAVEPITPPDGYSIEGQLEVGQTVSLDADGWQPADVVLDVHWYADNGEVGGSGWDETPLDLELRPDMLGKTISAEVVATVDSEDPLELTLTAATPVQMGVWTMPQPVLSAPVAAGKQVIVDLPDLPTAVQPTFQWLLDGVKIGAPSETGVYTPTDEQIGHTLSVVASAERDGYAPSSAHSAGSTVEDLPRFPVLPKVTVPTVVYAERGLTATMGVWPAGTTLAYEADIDGAPYVGDASLTGLMLDASTIGHTYRLVVVASNPLYRDARVASDQRVVTGLFAVPGKPRISGSARVGSKLTATVGDWNPKPTFTYAWKIGAKTVSTASSYTPSSAYRGKKVTVTVKATLPHYVSVSQTSAAATIGYGSFTSAPTPKISGSARVGSTLKVSAGTWSPSATLRYQWLRNGAAIKGATKSSYKLTSSDWRKKVTVRVTASRSGYAATTRTSAAGAAVTKPFSRTKAPTVSGTLRVGSTLTAKASGWSPSATFTYQWKRDGSKISGATHKTYKLASTDYGKKITVTVTGKRSGYVTASRTSASTKSVSASVGQQAALRKAQSYIDLMAFSKAGLYEQLTSPYGEGFTASQAQFAVDHVRVNWNAEAAEAARSYMALFNMSRDELYEQLTSPYGEQFTDSQALAGLRAVGY